MVNKEILNERERIKEIIQRKFFYTIKQRKKIKHRKRRLISLFNKLEQDILFSINNPDYVRKT